MILCSIHAEDGAAIASRYARRWKGRVSSVLFAGGRAIRQVAWLSFCRSSAALLDTGMLSSMAISCKLYQIRLSRSEDPITPPSPRHIRLRIWASLSSKLAKASLLGEGVRAAVDAGLFRKLALAHPGPAFWGSSWLDKGRGI